MKSTRSTNMNQTVKDVHALEGKLRGLSGEQLKNFVNDLREQVFDKRFSRESLLTPVLAASSIAVQRTLGLELYDVQVQAAHALMTQQIAEMRTGEGKTMSAVPAAVFGGILGRGAHVATPNAYLAKRDFEQLRCVYNALGLTVGHLDDDPFANNGKAAAYASDITYGTGYEFGFDYLRDQTLLKAQSKRGPGEYLLDTLRGTEQNRPAQTRGLGFSIVDEIDNVLIDDASSPQVLSEFQSGTASDIDAVQLARILALDLVRNEHFEELPWGDYRLTQTGVDLIHGSSVPLPVEQLVRPWAKYVESALLAAFQFQKDVDYVLTDGRVRIVEQSTGRIFEDRSWQSGLHQAIEAKEGVKITPEPNSLAQITRQRFYRLYTHLSGMTGTAQACAKEFKSIYDLRVVEIPLRKPSRRSDLPLRAFTCSGQKWMAIAESTYQLHQQGRPVLIGARTILESQVIASNLEELGMGFELLNGKQDAEEADIISRAGQKGTITIATNLAGRGTDIHIDQNVESNGGLHVIVSECHSSARVDRQLIGRCARQGQAGSCQTFVSADDWLFVTHAPWFSDSLRWATKGQNNDLDLLPKIRKIQASIEKRNFANRLQLLRANERKEKVLTSTK